MRPAEKTTTASSNGGRPVPSINTPPTMAAGGVCAATSGRTPIKNTATNINHCHIKSLRKRFERPTKSEIRLLLVQLIDVTALIELFEITKRKQFFGLEFLHQWIARAHDIERRVDRVHVRIGLSAHLMLRVILVSEIDHIAVFGAQQITEVLAAPFSLVEKKPHSIQIASHVSHHDIGSLGRDRRRRNYRTAEKRQGRHVENAKAIA